MQSPATRAGLLHHRVPDNDLLSHGGSVLSSARHRFTVLFGMGRRGASGLWSSGIDLRSASSPTMRHRGARDRREEVKRVRLLRKHHDRYERQRAHGYGVKPHGLLVSVSSTRCRASTPDLSTWWSATTLEGDQVPGRSNLQARFPLRCFQRLSLPCIATRRYDWRHNRYTRGTSTPVLSY